MFSVSASLLLIPYNGVLGKCICKQFQIETKKTHKSICQLWQLAHFGIFLFQFCKSMKEQRQLTGLLKRSPFESLELSYNYINVFFNIHVSWENSLASKRKVTNYIWQRTPLVTSHTYRDQVFFITMRLWLNAGLPLSTKKS